MRIELHRFWKRFKTGISEISGEKLLHNVPYVKDLYKKISNCKALNIEITYIWTKNIEIEQKMFYKLWLIINKWNEFVINNSMFSWENSKIWIYNTQIIVENILEMIYIFWIDYFSKWKGHNEILQMFIILENASDA